MKNIGNKPVVFNRVAIRLLAIVMLLLVNTLSQVARSEAGVFYVSPTGSGTACTQVDPCVLHAALDIADANGENDTIYLAAGTYEGNFSANTEAGKILIIRGEPGTAAADVILDGIGTGRVLSLYSPVSISTINTIRVEGLTVQNGMASRNGGGIWFDAQGDEALNLEILNSVIRYNQAERRGGGIYVHSYDGNNNIDLLIVNSLIYGNQAGISGGGIHMSASEVGENNVTRVTIINSIVTGNAIDPAVEGGGGIYVYAYNGIGAIASLDLYNTIVYGNTHLGVPQDLRVYELNPGRVEIYAYYCDIGNVTIDSIFTVPTYEPVNIISRDPNFADPSTGDYHLTACSPCIDRGTTEVAEPPGLPATDFEGNDRVYGSAPDIGAYESSFTQSVLLGDVDCNDQITPGDALCTFWRSILGSFQEECECECSAQAAEINCDGAITPGDALCIFWRAILGDWTEECQCLPTVKVASTPAASRIFTGNMELFGETLTLSLLVDNPHHLDAFSMRLSYPADVLEFIEVTPVDVTRNWTALDGEEVDRGVISLGGFHTEPVSSEGRVSIAELTFRLNGDFHGEVSLDLLDATDDLAGVPFARSSVTVSHVPTQDALHQNYPNPFNPNTDIRYQIADCRYPSHTTLTIYNILGQEVRVLVDEIQEPGFYTVTWDGRDGLGQEVPSGVYFYRLTTGDFTSTKRMVFMK